MGIPAPTTSPVIYLVEPFGGSMRRHNLNLPHVFWDDAAVTRGDGVFETLLIAGGEVVNGEKHVARLKRSAALLDLPEPDGATWLRATEQAVADFVEEAGLAGEDKRDELAQLEAKCVWTYSRGRETTGVPTAWVTVRPLPAEIISQRANGITVMTAPKGYSIHTSGSSEPNEASKTAPWLTVGAKSLNYAASMAAQRWARDHGFDDVIYTDPESGRVLEGATASVLVVKGDKKMRTPVTGGDVLPGTTQAAVFDLAAAQGWRCKEKDLTVDDLFEAEQVWLVSSVRGGVRVTAIDGKKLRAPGKKAESHVRAIIDQARTGRS